MEKGLSEERMLGKVRAIEVETGSGMHVKDACRKVGISDNTYYKWRRYFGGIDRGGLQRMKDLEKENKRLKQAVLDLQMDKQILKESHDFFLKKRQ